MEGKNIVTYLSIMYIKVKYQLTVLIYWLSHQVSQSLVDILHVAIRSAAPGDTFVLERGAAECSSSFGCYYNQQRCETLACISNSDWLTWCDNQWTGTVNWYLTLIYIIDKYVKYIYFQSRCEIIIHTVRYIIHRPV